MSTNQDSNYKPSPNGRNNGELPGGNGGPGTHSQPFEDEEIDLRNLLLTLFRYKWIIAICLIAGTAGGYYYASLQTPIYQGSGSMIIAEDRGRYSMAGTDLSSMLSTSFGIGKSRRIHNELEVIRSRQFLGEIADNLLEDPYQPDGQRWPIICVHYPEDTTLADRVTVTNRIYSRLAVDLKDQESDIVQVSFQSPSRQEAKHIVDQVLDQYYDFSTRQSRRQARAAIDFLDQEEAQLKNQLIENENQLRDFMNREGVVQLDAQSTRLVNTLAELEAERKSVEIERVAVNSAVENYEEELEAIRPGLADQFAAGRSQRLNRYQFQLAELETEKMLMISKNPQLRDNPSAEPSYLRLQDQARELQQEIRALTEDLMDQDERFLGFLDSQEGGLTSRLSDLRQELMSLKIKRNQLNAQASVLDERIEQEERFFDRIPDNMVEMSRLERDRKVSEQLYLTVSQQTAELAVWEQTQMGYGRVVDYSTLPDTPVSPRTRMIVLIGFILGGTIGVGYTFLRETTITEINSIEKLKDRNYPLMAVIPDLRGSVSKHYNGNSLIKVGGYTVSTDMVTLLDAISPATDAYRRLQSNMLYSNPDKPCRVIGVSSPNKDEGKTTVMANLGVVLAESGKNVMILDCDFRRPRMHREFGVDDKPGVVEYLFDEYPLESIIQPTLVDGVHMIAAGKRTLNPARLAFSARLSEMIDTIKEYYDIVLVDAPPYGIITDAAPLLTKMDGIILVTRFNFTREADLDHTIETLQGIRANIIGTVMTAFDPKKATGQYYTSSYYKYAYKSYNKYVKDT